MPIILLLVSFLLSGSPGRAATAPGTQFATDLYAQLRETKGNLFFSPASIDVAMSMTFGGAGGDTGREIARALHIADPSRVHEAQRVWLESLSETSSQPYRLILANSFWAQKGFDFHPAFLRLLEQSYRSSLFPVDFQGNSEEARKEINHWVAEKTHDKIQDLIPSQLLDRRTILVLVNAIYFKAAWQHPFSSDMTQKLPFYTDEKNEVPVPLMHQARLFRYYEDKELQAVELPYFGQEIAMVLILPRARTGLAALEKTLDLSHLDRWVAGLSERQVQLAMPRFRLDAEFNLRAVLQKLGIQKAFGPGADFSGMSAKPGIALSEVVHKAYVDVNEKGTEAAAATAVMAFRSSVMIHAAPPVKLVADHPFLFLIRNRHDGRLLFLGRLETP